MKSMLLLPIMTACLAQETEQRRPALDDLEEVRLVGGLGYTDGPLSGAPEALTKRGCELPSE